MTITKARELRELSEAELQSRETGLVDQLFALRLQKVTGQLDNPAKARQIRRELARVLTVLREKATSADGGKGV